MKFQWIVMALAVALGWSDAVLAQTAKHAAATECSITAKTIAQRSSAHHSSQRASQRANQQATTLVDVAVSAGKFRTLVAAVKAAGLVPVLQGEGPYTVFAPTDEAFAKLPKGTVEELLLPENREHLVKILTYHVIPGKLLAEDVVALNGAKTVQGQRVKFRQTRNDVQVNNALVLKTDIAASNGIIHVIDNVLLPQ